MNQSKMVKDKVGERMATIETKIDNLDAKIDDHIEQQRKDFETVFKKFDELPHSFAYKYVETKVQEQQKQIDEMRFTIAKWTAGGIVLVAVVQLIIGVIW